MTERVWVVRAGDGDSVGAIVARAAPGDERAIDEGRVFVGRRRAKSAAETVGAGDVVRIAAAAEARGDARVLAEGRGWVAVDKPAGVVTIPDHGGLKGSLVDLTARAVGLPAAGLHATSRLDRDVSGVVVFATTKDAAARLKAARDHGEYARRYVALAVRAPTPEAGTWDAPIGRAKDARHRAAFGRDAVSATTLYAVVARAAGGTALLALSPVTGRTHQLRVHAAHAGAPLLGDRVYGGPTRLTLPSGAVVPLGRVLLHAACVTIEGTRIESPVADELGRAWTAVGGDGPAWERAIEQELPAR